MDFKYNVTGQERKALVEAISEILQTPAHYNGAPTFSYTIGEYHIDKNGTVTGEWNLRLMIALESRGFEYELSKTFYLITPRGTLLIQEQFLTAEDAQSEGYDIYFSHEGRDIYIKPSGTSEHGKYFAVVGEPFGQEETDGAEVTDISTDDDGGIDTITIEYLLEGFTPETLDNLVKMVESKEVLIKTALNTDSLPIKVLDDSIAFPWFKYTDNANLNAYMQFITLLCQTAQEKKRVIAKAQETFENPRFAMRVWLIGLGMVGAEFATARKILTKPLEGNGAYRYGRPTPASEEETANV
ncbi:MAG: hypothetical protein LBM41_01535 [Ruminococcus sp.]|jgi:hypothetical protein|nr:hypothetical protein [Ruminococcus sp.]